MHKFVYMYKIMVGWLSVCMYVCMYMYEIMVLKVECMCVLSVCLYVYMFALLFLKVDVYHDNKKPSS